jgi:hypothetical protein
VSGSAAPGRGTSSRASWSTARWPNPGVGSSCTTRPSSSSHRDSRPMPTAQLPGDRPRAGLPVVPWRASRRISSTSWIASASRGNVGRSARRQRLRPAFSAGAARRPLARLRSGEAASLRLSSPATG